MNKAAIIVRWTARILSLLSIGLLLFFLFNGNNGSLEIGAREAVLLILFPFGIIVGMAVGWWRELVGGLIAVGSLALFFGMHRYWFGYVPEGPYFGLFTLPGALFLFAWVLSKKRNSGGV